MTESPSVDNDNSDINNLNIILENLIDLRGKLRTRLSLVEKEIASIKEIIAVFSGNEMPISNQNIISARTPVRMEILKILDSTDTGYPARGIIQILLQTFGDNFHPKSPYGVLKRLADEGMVERKGSVWTITTTGKLSL